MSEKVLSNLIRILFKTFKIQTTFLKFFTIFVLLIKLLIIPPVRSTPLNQLSKRNDENFLGLDSNSDIPFGQINFGNQNPFNTFKDTSFSSINDQNTENNLFASLPDDDDSNNLTSMEETLSPDTSFLTNQDNILAFQPNPNQEFNSSPITLADKDFSFYEETAATDSQEKQVQKIPVKEFERLAADPTIMLQYFATIAKATYCKRVLSGGNSDTINAEIYYDNKNNRNRIVVVFAANENFIDSYFPNNDISMKSWPHKDGGSVHGDLYTLYKSWSNQNIESYKNVIEEKGKPVVYFVGFGIGGALAEFAAVEINQAVKDLPLPYVITYGMPRVSDQVNANYVESKALVWRVTYGLDPYPRKPSNGKFKHPGFEFYIPRGKVTGAPCPAPEKNLGVATESKSCINQSQQVVQLDHFGPYFGFSMLPSSC
ncbi:hypothetical protein G9A89_002342 [Geosiphon pyriformis]|nr:hypothetical protein G9A89_002342 [Geosiphon pyriformis]